MDFIKKKKMSEQQPNIHKPWIKQPVQESYTQSYTAKVTIM